MMLAWTRGAHAWASHWRLERSRNQTEVVRGIHRENPNSITKEAAWMPGALQLQLGSRQPRLVAREQWGKGNPNPWPRRVRPRAAKKRGKGGAYFVN